MAKQVLKCRQPDQNSVFTANDAFCVSMKWLIIILNNQFIFWSIKCEKYPLQFPKVDVVACLTKTPKPKDIKFTIAQDKDKQQILTIYEIEQEMFVFCWKIT